MYAAYTTHPFKQRATDFHLLLVTKTIQPNPISYASYVSEIISFEERDQVKLNAKLTVVEQADTVATVVPSTSCT